MIGKTAGIKTELLIGGEESFQVILKEIRASRRNIYINMFIWRDDIIGNTVAQALLDAADRGVMVEIVKDRYGILCEYSEEDKSSFFHKDPSLKERLEILCMEIPYQPGLILRKFSMGDGELLHRMQNHQNIIIRANKYRRDHSKFYLFDDKTVVLGGINIEDKEIRGDRHGHLYLDYMVRIESHDVIDELNIILRGGACSDKGVFGLNMSGNPETFGIRKRYKEMFNEARQEITIVMAYIMPLDDMMEALEHALDRGVKIRLLIPARANYLNTSNHYTALQLYDYSNANGGKLELYMSEMMTHIKAIVTDQTITTGSANMTGKAFEQLGELNVFLPNDEGAFAHSIITNIETVFEKAVRVTSRSQLKYSKFMLFWEKLVMSR